MQFGAPRLRRGPCLHLLLTLLLQPTKRVTKLRHLGCELLLLAAQLGSGVVDARQLPLCQRHHEVEPLRHELLVTLRLAPLPREATHLGLDLGDQVV